MCRIRENEVLRPLTQQLTYLVILFFSPLSLITNYNELYPPLTYTDQCERTFILLVYVHQMIQLTKPTYT